MDAIKELKNYKKYLMKSIKEQIEMLIKEDKDFEDSYFHKMSFFL